MYVTDRGNIAPVAEVHGDVFGAVRPASTALVVEALIEPSLLVEIEADAHRA
jgi:enamine deaminase RidA (YjgF/YER057c/UK114 family)